MIQELLALPAAQLTSRSEDSGAAHAAPWGGRCGYRCDVDALGWVGGHGALWVSPGSSFGSSLSPAPCTGSAQVAAGCYWEMMALVRWLLCGDALPCGAEAGDVEDPQVGVGTLG